MLNYFQTWQVLNILVLSEVHMFIFNSMIPVANTKLGIAFEHVGMLKIQTVWNSSSTFFFILPPQRPLLGFDPAQNFFK